VKKAFNSDSDNLCAADAERFFLIKLKTLHLIFTVVLQDCSIHTDIIKLVTLL